MTIADRAVLVTGANRGIGQALVAEAVDPEGRQWPRTKRNDDATAVYLVLDVAASL
jgi:NAD(P)-dependent dehydrogenase (short-subunit alcohol dehydrogenase family)